MERSRCCRNILGVLLLALVGCSSDPSAPTTTSFGGTVVGPSGESGTLAVTVNSVLASSRRLRADGDVTATGVLKFGSTTHNLTGTYNTTDKTFSLTGDNYTFTGTVADDKATGSYTGPNGNGKFSSLKGSPTAFCGTYTGNGGGTWNLTFTAATGLGDWRQTDGSTSGHIACTRTGNDITCTDEYGDSTGTISNDTITGSYEGGGGGTFTGGPC